MPHLVNIHTKKYKKGIIKKCWVLKNEKSCKLRLMFPFSSNAVFEIHCSIAVFVRVFVFLVLVFTWILAWVCALYCFIIDFLWNQLITWFATALQWVLQPYFEHFCLAIFVVFIYSSAFLGSFYGACFYFPAFNFLLVNSWLSF